MRDEERAGGDEVRMQIVLVVDGRPTRQFYTSVFLQRLKYHVITANSAEDALIFADMTVPLVIIADINLPGMSGIELLRRVKQKHRTRHVPVIIYAKKTGRDTEEACRQAGCADFVAYPCSLDELYAAVERATSIRPRRFARLDTFLSVQVGDETPAGGQEPFDRISAISELGMFVSTARPLPYGKVLPFAFTLPTAPGWVITVEGQVLYQHLSKDLRKQPGMGVKFLKVGEAEQELIRDFIRRKLMEGIATDRLNSDE